MKLIKKCKYILPPIITLVIFSIILLIKQIYPFGKVTVDYYDMAQQIAAFYYHIYDVLHGEKSLFLDPYTALSVNMAMSTSGCSHLSVFNLFFLFIKRNMLLESLSYFLGLKMAVMTTTMYIYLHKERKLPYVFEVIFSVGYAFCGFVLILYVTIQWMDIAAIFPIIMLFMHKLIREGKSRGYIITLTLSLIASYYISFMILIYIVLIVGLELMADRIFEKDNKKKYHLTALFIETVISILLSSFIIIPQLKQTLTSARFNNETDGSLIGMYMGIINTVKPAYTTRWFSLAGLSFAFAVIAVGLFKNIKNKKILFLTVGSLFIVLTELVIESVNLIWHFGSYVQYPIRNGFIIYFTVVCVAAYFLQEENIKFSGFSHIVIMSVICLTALILGVRKYMQTPGLSVRNVLHIVMIVMAICFVIYVVGYIAGKGKLLGFVPAILFAELIFYGVLFIGKPAFITGYSEEPEQEGEYIRICSQLERAFDIKPDDEYAYLFDRIKNPDESLNANYGLVLRRPALSNWTHLLNPALADSVSKLGYTVQFTRLLDSGGTVFSDALLGINNIITYIPQNEDLYELIDSRDVAIDSKTGKTKTYYYYKTRYCLPFGLKARSTQDVDFINADTEEVYNQIYHSISDDSENIAEWLYGGDLEKGLSFNNLSLSFDISDRKALYYFSDQVDTDDYNTVIFVDGYKLIIPSIKEWDNTFYPAHFNNNAVFMGTFEKESVYVNIHFNDTDKYGNKVTSEFRPRILAIDLDKLETLVNNYDYKTERKAYKSGYDFKVESEEDNLSFIIPVSYDNGYTATVNGKKVEVSSVGNVFMSVPLTKGENIIKIRFVPDGLIPGSFVSVIALCIVVFLFFYKKGILLDKIKIPYLDYIYLVGWCGIIAGMYIIPIVYGVVKCIK